MKDGKIKGKGEGIEAKIISLEVNRLEIHGLMNLPVMCGKCDGTIFQRVT